MGKCITPYYKKDDITQEYMSLPCGKCPQCLMRRAQGWIFRMEQESKRAQCALFLTLTYDTNTVPITERGYMTLKKKDVQDYLKRIRFSLYKRGVDMKKHPVKYYCAGEYGGKTNRPHYHIILFNVDESTAAYEWRKGNVHFGTAEGASIAYTTKYIMKQPLPKHGKNDRAPEFSLMSKRLGANYLSKEKYPGIRPP